jgi:hypothetical protein
MPQCKARSKRSKVQCKNNALIGLKTCKFHGGKQPTGELSPVFKTGRYCKSLSGKLLAHYEEGFSDVQQILDMTSECVLLDTRTQQLTSELEEEEGGSTFEDVAGALIDLRHKLTLDLKKGTKLPEELQTVEDLVRAGWDREEKWNEVLKTIEQRRKVSETEVKRLAASRTMVPIQQVKQLLSQLGEQYKQAVFAIADPSTANKILADASQRRIRVIESGPSKPL